MRSLVGKKLLIIVGFVALAVVAAMLANTYFGQVRELDELRGRHTVAKSRLPGIAAEKSDLQDQFTAAESSITRNARTYPNSLHSIEYGEHLFDIAGKSYVTLGSLSFPGPNATKDGPVTYSVASFSLPLRGTRAGILDFIQTLRTDPRFATTRVNSVSMSGEGASISVAIYGYREQ